MLKKDFIIIFIPHERQLVGVCFCVCVCALMYVPARKCACLTVYARVSISHMLDFNLAPCKTVNLFAIE